MTLSTLLLVVAPSLAVARTVERSLEEFLAAQGTFCVPDGSGGCLLLQPPLPNFLGWEDPDHNRGAFVDYAGVAARYIESATGGTISLGTSFSGRVTERPLADGTAEITVYLETSNALTWGLGGLNAVNSPLFFGHRPTEVVAGAPPSLGDSTMHIRFIIPEPGLPLPDLVELIIFPQPFQQHSTLMFTARSEGELREAFGVPDGTSGRMTIAQVNVERPGGVGATPFPAQISIMTPTGP
jgi:hypothetical protein